MENAEWVAWLLRRNASPAVHFAPPVEMILENQLQWPMHIPASRNCFLRMEVPRLEPAADIDSARKARRMIKNRESAARSRERKQAYTDQLKCEVEQLKELNLSLEKRLALIKKLDDDFAASPTPEKKRQRSFSVEF